MTTETRMIYEAWNPRPQVRAMATGAERVVHREAREHADPSNFPVNLPEAGDGEDTFAFTVPPGLQMSRWEVRVVRTSPGAGHEVTASPRAGAEGAQRATVRWWHLPYGSIRYELVVYASPDGTASPAPVVVGETGWDRHAREQLGQGAPVALAVRGDKAKALHELIQKQEQTSAGEAAPPVRAQEVITTVVVIAVIAAVVVVIGMFVLGAVIAMAMQNGYDVKDTKYKAATGQGETRQEHELAFNLIQPPGAPASAARHASAGVYG